MRLIRAIELEALDSLANFTTGDQAFERRGTVHGIVKIKQELISLSGNIHINDVGLNKFLRENTEDAGDGRSNRDSSGSIY